MGLTRTKLVVSPFVYSRLKGRLEWVKIHCGIIAIVVLIAHLKQTMIICSSR